ncbi:MAG TPA: hypothetical protein PKA00_09585 [Saprospiraceae bacterium]|nr:hypothetical protein [Saprospiraceae bacterium]HMQ83150.1 hypothetical protein [Saprospiraceae bacterium]
MKKTLTLLLFFFFLTQTFGQSNLSASEWQADLAFLKETVHKDYPFLFKKITAAEWDAQVDKLHEAIPMMQPHEIVAGIGRLVSAFKYGHTDIGWGQIPVQSHLVPLNLYWFSDGIYVEGCHKDYAAALGAKLLKVEGMPIEKALDAVRALTPVENEQFFKAYGLDMLLVPEALHAQGVSTSLKKTITFTLEQGGKTFDKTFDAIEATRLPRQYGLIQASDDWLSVRDQNDTPFYLKNLDKIYYFEYLPDSKTVYVRHSQIQDEQDDPIPAFYARVFDFIEKNEVDRLVLDVRLNGGGNNYKNKPIVTGLIRCEKINQPGKLFVIIGRRTFSACQNLVNEIDTYTNALFIGEPTSENINFYGDNRRVELPNSKIPVFLSFAWWQDKPQWENADWLAPDIAVEMSFEDYRANRDTVLAAAINISAEGLVIDPMGHMQALYMAGKLDEIKSEAAKMIVDPRYKFINFESEINSKGYNLMQGGQMEAAYFVFQLNTELFPMSANVWDSFAEVNWKSGNKDKAIQFYKKAISLDPHGGVGDNARAMLKEVEAGK